MFPKIRGILAITPKFSNVLSDVLKKEMVNNKNEQGYN